MILRSFPGIWSGPGALFTLMFSKSLRTPFFETWMEESLHLLFKGGIVKGVPGVENTPENWALKRFAFCLGSVTHAFLSRMSGMPVFSFL